MNHESAYESYDAPIAAFVDDIESSGSVAQYVQDIEQRFLASDSAAVYQLRRIAKAFEPVGQDVLVDTTYPLATKVYWGALLGTALSEKIFGTDACIGTLYKYARNSYADALTRSVTTIQSSPDDRREICSGILIKEATAASMNLIDEHVHIIGETAREIAPTEHDYKHIILGFSYIMGHAYRHIDHLEAVHYSASLEIEVAELFDKKFLKSFGKKLRHLDAPESY